MAELTVCGNQTLANQVLPALSTFPDSSAGSMNSQFTSLTAIHFIDLAKYFLLRCCKSVSTSDIHHQRTQPFAFAKKIKNVLMISF